MFVCYTHTSFTNVYMRLCACIDEHFLSAIPFICNRQDGMMFMCIYAEFTSHFGFSLSLLAFHSLPWIRLCYSMSLSLYFFSHVLSIHFLRKVFFNASFVWICSVLVLNPIEWRNGFFPSLKQNKTIAKEEKKNRQAQHVIIVMCTFDWTVQQQQRCQ